MHEGIWAVLDYILAITTVTAKVLMLRKIWWAPIFGLAIQSVWITYAFVFHEYGFFITPAIMGPIYAYHVKKWSNERFVNEFVSEHNKEYIEEEHNKHPEWNIK